MDHATIEATPYRGEDRTFPRDRDMGSVARAAARFVPATDETHKLIAILEDRLSPILNGEGPSIASEVGRALPSTPPLAEQLDQHANAIDNANGRLARLLDRIDL